MHVERHRAQRSVYAPPAPQLRRTLVPRNDQLSARQAHELLRASLRIGKLRRGDRLSETALVRSLSASRSVVREALTLLALEGVVARRPRKGTWVVHGIRSVPTDEIPIKRETESGYRLVLLDARVLPAPPLIGQRLGLADQQLLMVEHLAIWDDEPFCIRTRYLPVSTRESARGVDMHVVGAEEFAADFEGIYGLPPGDSECTIQALSSGLRTSQLLNMPEGSPVLLREILMSDSKGTVREVMVVHYRADRVALSAKATVRYVHPPATTDAEVGP